MNNSRKGGRRALTTGLIVFLVMALGIGGSFYFMHRANVATFDQAIAVHNEALQELSNLQTEKEQAGFYLTETYVLVDESLTLLEDIAASQSDAVYFRLRGEARVGTTKLRNVLLKKAPSAEEREAYDRVMAALPDGHKLQPETVLDSDLLADSKAGAKVNRQSLEELELKNETLAAEIAVLKDNRDQALAREQAMEETLSEVAQSLGNVTLPSIEYLSELADTKDLSESQIAKLREVSAELQLAFLSLQEPLPNAEHDALYLQREPEQDTIASGRSLTLITKLHDFIQQAETVETQKAKPEDKG